MSPALQRRLPLLTTAAVFAALYVTAGFLYDGFFSPGVAASLLTDNAALGITAVGLTLVIFSGGIDLSVGAVVGFTSIFTATLVAQGWHPAAAAGLAVGIGAALGAGMGAVVHFFKQPPFLITLAGMFLMRGLAYWISTESTAIDHPVFLHLAGFELQPVPGFYLTATGIGLLAVLLVGGVLAHYTRFGRNVIAIGGSEPSALLMGLPVGAAKIGAYTLCSVCAVLAGLAGTVYTSSGNPSLGLGLELDAIAVVVIGGTLLTGGRGHLLGTVLGLLIFGTIQAALIFDGRLDPAWIRIVVGGLLLAFILLQRTLVQMAGKR
jgi:galactofuranose transport system permease protein